MDAQFEELHHQRMMLPRSLETFDPSRAGSGDRTQLAHLRCIIVSPHSPASCCSVVWQLRENGDIAPDDEIRMSIWMWGRARKRGAMILPSVK